MMIFKTFEINGIYLIDTKVFIDERGMFYESFNQVRFEEVIGKKINFVQDNISISKKGVIRGLHFQKEPYQQGKLVRVLVGSVLDVAVDIRRDSPTFGQHVKVMLSAENNRQFWIPEGFAHGFVALEENTVFSYKCTNYYHPASESGIRYDDPELNIDWEFENVIVNQKDINNPYFCDFCNNSY